MSTFIWGKIKFKKKIIMHSYQRKNILIFLDCLKNDLFQCDLNEGEVYFNIACGYDEMIYPSTYKMPYLNCDDTYFSINSTNEKTTKKHFDELFLRINRLQDVIIEIFKNENVEKITYYHTETGNENSIDEYELVDWKLEEFAGKFFSSIIDNMGFTPTIKVIFDKSIDNINL